MDLKKEIAAKEEARMEKQVIAMNSKNKEASASKKRGRHKKTLAQSVQEAFNKAYDVDVKKAPVADVSQTAKADCGKPHLSLVPMDILTAIARVREYGNKKYKDPDNWKTVEVPRYRDAMLRHMVAYINEPKSIDAESGLPHLWHLACNIAFLISLENK